MKEFSSKHLGKCFSFCWCDGQPVYHLFVILFCENPFYAYHFHEHGSKIFIRITDFQMIESEHRLIASHLRRVFISLSFLYQTSSGVEFPHYLYISSIVPQISFTHEQTHSNCDFRTKTYTPQTRNENIFKR